MFSIKVKFDYRPKDSGHNLRAITEKLYASYYCRNKEERTNFPYVVPDFPEGYGAEVKGHFESEEKTELIYIMHYVERGSMGSSTYFETIFTLESGYFSVTDVSNNYQVEIEVPSEDLEFLNALLDELGADPHLMEYVVRLSPMEINSALAFAYFNKIKDEMDDFTKAFELNSALHPPLKKLWQDEKKQLLYNSTDQSFSINLTYWTSIQKEHNRNYSGVILEIDQTCNQDLPQKFLVYLTHQDPHRIGQTDFTVDRAIVTSSKKPNEEALKALELNLRTWLLLIEAL